MATFEVNNSEIVSQGPSLKRIPTNLPLLHGCKRIGPVVLKDSPTTSSAQLGIIYVYAFFVIFKALAGPGPLFIFLWRMCITLASYYFSGRLLVWEMGAQSDLLLAPAVYVAIHLLNIVSNVIDQYGMFKVYLHSQIMRESLVEVGAAFKPKK